MSAKYPTPADAEIKASILPPALQVHQDGWYRDKQDLLWMDAELQADGNFILYRSGAGPRIYAPDGRCLKDGDDLTPHTRTHLAYEIDRKGGPIAPIST